ncbi:hypothetical protein ACFVG9_21850 [Saccharothrix carnea]|nr:hypothetical protein A6A25_35155 [Saccharothrix sp. CB00851]
MILAFLAGVTAANATPHFVRGITKRPFPTPFGPSPVVNFVAGWAMYVLAALLAVWADMPAHPVAAGIAVAVGVLLMGLFHAVVGAFGRGADEF